MELADVPQQAGNWGAAVKDCLHIGCSHKSYSDWCGWSFHRHFISSSHSFWPPPIIYTRLKNHSDLLPAMTACLVLFSPVCVCVHACVFVCVCHPEDTCYSRSSFEQLARCLYVCLCVDRFCQRDSITTVQDALMNLYRRVSDFTMKADGCGLSREYWVLM